MQNLRKNEYEEVCFSQKNVYKCVKMGFPLWAWVEKTVHGVEICWLSDKEKCPGAVISKEVYADSLLEYE